MATIETGSRTTQTKINNNKIELEDKGKLTFIDFDKAKEQILTELFLSTEFKNKIRKVIVDRQVQNLSVLYEEVMQEVMVEMTKKDGEYLFNQYIKSRGSIMALAITIAKSFFRTNPAYPDYPNKSIVHRLNFHSTITGRADWISPVDVSGEEGDYTEVEKRAYVASDNGIECINTLGGTDTANKIDSCLDRLKSTLNKKQIKTLDRMVNFFNKDNYHKDTKKYSDYLDKNKDFLILLKGRLNDLGITDYQKIFI